MLMWVDVADTFVVSFVFALLFSRERSAHWNATLDPLDSLWWQPSIIYLITRNMQLSTVAKRVWVCIDEANWLCVSPRSREEEEARRNHKFTFYGVSALCAVIAFVCLITGEAGGIINARKTEKPRKPFRAHLSSSCQASPSSRSWNILNY